MAAAFQQALDAPEVKARVAQLGSELQKSSPEQARTSIEQQINLCGQVVKEPEITIE